MSRYAREDPRSIFFGGTSRTNPSPGPGTPETEAPPSPGGTQQPAPAAEPPAPVVRIIPILYPAQPARLIGNNTGYGAKAALSDETAQPANDARPAAAGTASGVRSAPSSYNPYKPPPPPTTPSSSAAAAAPRSPRSPNGTGAPAGGAGLSTGALYGGILKPPYTPGATQPSTSTAPHTSSRVSFSTRPDPSASRGQQPAAAAIPSPPPIETEPGVAPTSPDMASEPGSSSGGGATGANGVHKAGHHRSSSSRMQGHQQQQQQQESGTAAPPPPASGSTRVQLALYGWRKKCLYALILLLTIMIIINMALTLWIMKVMEFSSNGMGQLKIVPGGIQLTGQALVLNTLRASSIRSKHGQPISIESSRNLSVNTRSALGTLENQLFLGHDRLEVLANHFRITDTHGTNLFAVDRDEVTVGAGSLRVEGEGGVIFRDSIQTPLVRADAGKDLKLESPTRSLEARATQEIFIQSRAGGIETTCLNDLKLHSVAGSIRLDGSAIYMPNLKTVQGTAGGLGLSGYTTSSSSSLLASTGYGGRGGSGGEFGGGGGAASGASAGTKIYQLCACSSGKLFLATPNSICSADDTAICR
ncbi:uncharacterized protein LOC118460357 isoform X2 [Anopheles albimanus]|uniref:uncharacterized protein LOC118460357 isoform X2 n=1 Tax=Anopheles albimanus TaxID=7167 RepID=UPI00163E7664|nr:uncharacterized protein LOC118460357 isoform X2 [Anopheles albimanus]